MGDLRQPLKKQKGKKERRKVQICCSGWALVPYWANDDECHNYFGSSSALLHKLRRTCYPSRVCVELFIITSSSASPKKKKKIKSKMGRMDGG
jgi:hypothetical protein